MHLCPVHLTICEEASCSITFCLQSGGRWLAVCEGCGALGDEPLALELCEACAREMPQAQEA